MRAPAAGGSPPRWTGTIVASSVSFGLYFVIAGAVFLDAYQVPKYGYQDWQLLAAVPLGLFAALVTSVLGLVLRLWRRCSAG